MKKYILSFIILFVFSGVQNLYAQVNDTTINKPYQQGIIMARTYRVAIFAPLYMDSLFTGNILRSQTSIPGFAMAGLDFVQGAQLALDTLTLNGKHVEAFIYDSKSLKNPVLSLIRNGKLDNLDLIIGSVKEPEYGLLAQFAAQKKIPFVSATYPNDGRVRQNPYLIIVNSTLKSHCEGIYSYILQKHGADNIYLIKKKNDNRIDNLFKEINFVDGRQLLKIRTIMLDSSISPAGLRYLVDTTKPMVIIGASLNETFSKKLADAVYPIQKTNKVVFIGMPNWDGFGSFYNKNTYTDFPIRFTTPHFDAKNNAFSNYLDSMYFKLYRARPSDMVEKGFETVYDFTSLLLNHPEDFMQHINDTIYAPLHDFNFRWVFHDKYNTTPDYYENKHLFIMQILNGAIIREW
ncbi:MAG TPA: ABC transporter substrate-binding protein [Hanamia sp.]|nr:ABC transporter substrate-binding protein [Hanamia sp.]